MARSLCLAHLSLIELAPPDLIEAAAAAGFSQVSVRLAPAAPGEHQHPMLGNTPMMRETLARMGELGVGVHDVELIRLDEKTDVAAQEPLMEAAARLGAAHILVAGDSADEGVVADGLARLAQIGARYGLKMGLEFMPWRGIRTLESALRVIEAAGVGGVVVDAIHLDRSGATVAQLAALPAHRWAYFQICDAPAQRPASQEEMVFQARQARMAPGDGGLDLVGMLRTVPRETAVSIEVPLHARPDLLPPVARARMLREATLRVMEQADAH